MVIEKNKNNLTYILITVFLSVAFIVWLGFYYSSFKKEINSLGLSETVSNIVKKTAEPIKKESSSWQVLLSADTLKQGDTLVIKVKTEKDFNGITAKFGKEKVYFFKSQKNDWFGIIGAGVKKEPGKYKLVVSSGQKIFEKDIAVVKKIFPTTELAMTKELEEKGYTTSNISQNIAQKDNVSIYDAFKIYTPTAYFSKPFIFPLKKIKIAGAFGNIRKSGDIELQHLGVDLYADENTPVYAINNGKIIFSEELINYGKTIIIDHGLGIYSLYLHLNEYKFIKGQKVAQGDVIGLSGNTGYSIAPHLHFSIKINRPDASSTVDPLKFIEATQSIE